MAPEQTDEQLMLGFRSGDARAFQSLVRRHRAAVFNFIVRYVGQKARAEALLQETWLKVVRGAEEYGHQACFTTWLYTVARNVCVDSARREGYRKAESLDGPAGADGALRALPEEQREVFILREYSGIAFKDIAAVTGVPEKTVKSRMRYALEGLRKNLAEEGRAPG